MAVTMAVCSRGRKATYTTDGLTSMFRRHCIAAKVSDFGLRDLRAKRATGDYRAGRPIRGPATSARSQECAHNGNLLERVDTGNGASERTTDDRGVEIDPN